MCVCVCVCVYATLWGPHKDRKKLNLLTLWGPHEGKKLEKKFRFSVRGRVSNRKYSLVSMKVIEVFKKSP